MSPVTAIDPVETDRTVSLPPFVLPAIEILPAFRCPPATSSFVVFEPAPAVPIVTAPVTNKVPLAPSNFRPFAVDAGSIVRDAMVVGLPTSKTTASVDRITTASAGCGVVPPQFSHVVGKDHFASPVDVQVL